MGLMNQSKLFIFAIAISMLVSGGFAHAQEKTLPSTNSNADTKPVIEPWGYPLDAFDPETRPQDDFYRHANGGWLDNTEIPSDRSGTGFSIIMRERNDARMQAIIDRLNQTRQRRGSDGKKIRDLYKAFMDSAQIEKRGLKPFSVDESKIRSAKTHIDIARLMADPELGLDGPFGIFVSIDSKNPDANALWASHSGLSMPDRSYYLRESERLDETRAAYKKYLTKVIHLKTSQDISIGEDTESELRANAVFALEKAIATLHWTRAERRNASRTYNKMTIGELATFAPGFPWADYASIYTSDDTTPVIVREKEAFPALATLFEQTPVNVWRDYLMVRYINANAEFMPAIYDDARFEFFGKTLSGQKTQRSRDKRAIGMVNLYFDQAIGKIYIAAFFPEESKRQVTEMFENIRTAFASRIDNLSWMTDETKAQAHLKLESVAAKIAYPEVWTDYSDVRIHPRKLFKNIKSLRRASFNRDLERLAKPVDRREWFRAPQTVNAFYSPTRNEAFIPAGYIQSPLFDPFADPALNYGALGSIIGHEIGHGFDDQGSKYDGRGILQSWWSDADREAFDALGDRLAAQFDQYESLPGLNVNGRQTLGENIGDLAGMTVAYHAYKLSLNGKEAPILDGLTGEQRFFLGRAQGRRFKRTEESLRQRLLSAPHSPMNLRVNGMIRNMDEWYDAYGVEEGDGLYLSPEDRVRIW